MEAWEQVFRANVTSTFLSARAVLPIFRQTYEALIPVYDRLAELDAHLLRAWLMPLLR